jgi:hypothetical protein
MRARDEHNFPHPLQVKRVTEDAAERFLGALVLFGSHFGAQGWCVRRVVRVAFVWLIVGGAPCIHIRWLMTHLYAK